MSLALPSDIMVNCNSIDFEALVYCNYRNSTRQSTYEALLLYSLCKYLRLDLMRSLVEEATSGLTDLHPYG